MNHWIIDNPQRMLSEQNGVADLQARSDWLTGVFWDIDASCLYCDATIRVHDHDYNIRLTYPAFFPDTPPSVAPREQGEQWSPHQYGAGGTLCLEWGPDNWLPEVTGAHLLESAFRLLYEENPLGDSLVPRHEVPSRHALTLGQELRFTRNRSFASEAFVNRALELPLGSSTQAAVSYNKCAGRYVYYALGMCPSGGEVEWEDTTLPEGLRLQDNVTRSGFVLKVDWSSERLGVIKEVEELVPLLISAGFEGWPHLQQPGFAVESGLLHALLINDAGDWYHFVLFDDEGKPALVPLARIPDDRTLKRQPQSYEQLEGVTVAVVGAGSLGSKIVVSLARAGIRRFLLIDHDVMLPGNVSRHASNWTGVGLNKVQLLAEEVRRIAPNTVVDAKDIHLNGQESNSVVAGALESVAKCSLIVDATADPHVFNLLGSIARRAEVPLVWGVVYAGGLGGLVARSRPELDPGPIAMRAAYLNYCQEHEVEAENLFEGHDYGIESAGTEPMVASDADVGVIAHHVTRFALDVLTGGERSAFPESLYLIGLRAGWVFERPFQNIAITVEKPLTMGEAATPYESLSTDEKKKFAAFLQELVTNNRRSQDETAATE